MASDVDKQRERLLRGEPLDGGWCFDPSRPKPNDIRKCSEEEAAIAEGKVSVSWDGKHVTNLETAEVTVRDNPPKEYRDRQVMTPMQAAQAAGGTVPAAGGDTVTTDNAPAGGRGRTTR